MSTFSTSIMIYKNYFENRQKRQVIDICQKVSKNLHFKKLSLK